MSRLRQRYCLAGVAGLFLFTSAASAGEKALMHCFAFTAIESASDADWQAFYKATDAMPSKIPGVRRVWYGKLRSPLQQFSTNRETGKKLAAGEKDVSGPVTRLVRQYGVCMEMADPATLKQYEAHPYHKEWVDVYSKVRVAGTTTFDILGQ